MVVLQFFNAIFLSCSSTGVLTHLLACLLACLLHADSAIRVYFGFVCMLEGLCDDQATT